MRRKLKRLLRLRNSSGFTLVEVIVACALLGILVIGVMGFAVPILSSIREKEKNARAFMLSEAISTYIYSTTQYAYYVSTFTGAAAKDTVGADETITKLTYTGTEFPKKNGKGLSTLKACYDKLGSDKYEIRCIGIRWREDQISGEKKLMVTNEKVDQVKLTLDPAKSRLVFEECFYNDLYPMITFENYSNQYQIKEGDTLVDRVEDKDLNIAPGLGLIVDVYTSLDCYNTGSGVREKAVISMSGTSYIGFNNIRSTITNPGSYEVVPNMAVNSYDDALAKEDASAVYSADGEDYYYPDSFIYYIVHKTIQG